MAYGKKQLQRDPLDRRTWSRVFRGGVGDITSGEKGGGTWQPENALQLNSTLKFFKTDRRDGWAALPVDNALQVNTTLKFFKPDRRDGRAALPVDNALQMNSTLKFFNLELPYNTIHIIAWGSLRIGATWDGRHPSLNSVRGNLAPINGNRAHESERDFSPQRPSRSRCVPSAGRRDQGVLESYLQGSGKQRLSGGMCFLKNEDTTNYRYTSTTLHRQDLETKAKTKPKTTPPVIEASERQSVRASRS